MAPNRMPFCKPYSSTETLTTRAAVTTFGRPDCADLPRARLPLGLLAFLIILPLRLAGLLPGLGMIVLVYAWKIVSALTNPGRGVWYGYLQAPGAEWHSATECY